MSVESTPIPETPRQRVESDFPNTLNNLESLDPDTQKLFFAVVGFLRHGSHEASMWAEKMEPDHKPEAEFKQHMADALGAIYKDTPVVRHPDDPLGQLIKKYQKNQE